MARSTMKLGPSPDTFTARDSLQSHEEALDRSALMRGLINHDLSKPTPSRILPMEDTFA
jgi:hypothetical protein